MDDASNEDARPLTKEERGQLADCLFRLFSAIHHSNKIQNEIILALRDRAGVEIDVSYENGLFVRDMSFAIDLIEKLNLSLGSTSDG